MTATPRPDNPANSLPSAPLTRVHLMGIGGTGMSALATMLQDMGLAVTGSDQVIYPPVSDYLAARKITVFKGYCPENLAAAPDLVIVGNVIRRTNPEAVALMDSGLHYLSMPQALSSLFLATRSPLVVAGTHGKTTTSSLLAHVLASVGQDPGFFIGGIVQGFGVSARKGSGPFFVVEGDEYDTAFFDKGPKFQHYRPQHAILTSVEFDHADIYADLDAVHHAFRGLAAIIAADGALVYCSDDPGAQAIANAAASTTIGYGLKEGGLWRAEDIRAAGRATHFSARRAGETLGRFCIPMPGRHNVKNALAVIALLAHLGIDLEAVRQGLASFHGVRRRQELRGEAAGVMVIDDFAHHPTAVKETLAALALAYPERRLVAVFEPRSNTSRRAVFQQQFAAAFDDAPLVFIKKPEPLAGVETKDMIDTRRLALDLADRSLCARTFPDSTALLAALLEEVRPGDVIAVLSNGGFDNIHEEILKHLA